MKKLLIASIGLAAVGAWNTSEAMSASVFNMGPGVTSLEFVTVGDPGNPADVVTGKNNGASTLGSVANTFKIAKYEVTNAQFVEFLNAKAQTDSLWPNLYDANMGTAVNGGITRSGSAGSYSYAVRTNMANKPVNYVDIYAAMRFVNWLNNGEGSGSAESGAYALNNSSNFSGTRSASATYFLPSEDEWHKAAYYQPAAQGGDTDGYWKQPTQSNSSPTAATASITGDISNPGGGVANYNKSANWNGSGTAGNLTTVGTAGNANYYGAYDMAGNVTEWTDTSPGANSTRITRGGGFDSSAFITASNYALISGGSSANATSGFRIATVVPEPASLSVVAVAGLAVLRRRRR